MKIVKIMIGGIIFMLLLDISKWILELAVTKPEYGFLILTSGILISLLSYGLASLLLGKSIKTYANRINENIDSKFEHQIKAKDKALSTLIKESLGISNKSIAAMIGDTDKSIVSMIGDTDRSIASMIGNPDKSITSMIGDTNKSIAAMIGSCDKSLVGLLGNSESGSVNYKLDTLINENQKHKDSLASMNSDTKQMHTYILSYTQKFEENARLVEELNQKVKKLQDENKRLREENQGLKKEFEILKDNDDKSKETVDEALDDIIGNLSHQNDEMDLER